MSALWVLSHWFSSEGQGVCAWQPGGWSKVVRHAMGPCAEQGRTVSPHPLAVCCVLRAMRLGPPIVAAPPTFHHSPTTRRTAQLQLPPSLLVLGRCLPAQTAARSSPSPPTHHHLLPPRARHCKDRTPLVPRSQLLAQGHLHHGLQGMGGRLMWGLKTRCLHGGVVFCGMCLL